jgi:hypothetical protein
MGSLAAYLAGDHRRLEGLLDRADTPGGTLDEESYALFRAGLLRHIAIEERILIPAALSSSAEALLPRLEQIRLDHGAIAALLVPPPTRGIIAALRAILQQHNVLEENADALYEAAERLLDDGVEAITGRARDAGEVRAQPHNPAPGVLDATRRAVARAGYDLDALMQGADSRTRG